MAAWIGLFTAVAGVLIAVLLDERFGLTWLGRLPGRIRVRLEMLEKLPIGEAHDELQAHVEHMVRQLVASDSAGMSLQERQARHGA